MIDEELKARLSIQVQLMMQQNLTTKDRRRQPITDNPTQAMLRKILRKDSPGSHNDMAGSGSYYSLYTTLVCVVDD